MMDIFKQKRFLGFVVALLVVLNAALLTLLWLGRPANRPGLAGGREMQKDRPPMEQMLRKELGFDDQQIQTYLELREKHQQQFVKLNSQLQQIKKQMFDQVFEENPDSVLSAELLDKSVQLQQQIDRITYAHLLALKDLCKADQQGQLKKLVAEVFKINRPQPGPPGKPGAGPSNRPGDMPPPPR